MVPDTFSTSPLICHLALNFPSPQIKTPPCLILPGGHGWLWGGCSDNVGFGEAISKQFVDALETGQDARAAMNLHNNEAGRKVLYSGLSLILRYLVQDVVKKKKTSGCETGWRLETLSWPSNGLQCKSTFSVIFFPSSSELH